MDTAICPECGHETDAEYLMTEFDPAICAFCAEDNHSYYGPYGCDDPAVLLGETKFDVYGGG